MTIEEIAVNAMNGILSNPEIFNAYERETMCEDIVRDSIEYAKEFKKQMSPFYQCEVDAEDVEYELIEE